MLIIIQTEGDNGSWIGAKLDWKDQPRGSTTSQWIWLWGFLLPVYEVRTVWFLTYAKLEQRRHERFTENDGAWIVWRKASVEVILILNSDRNGVILHYAIETYCVWAESMPINQGNVRWHLDWRKFNCLSHFCHIWGSKRPIADIFNKSVSDIFYDLR